VMAVAWLTACEGPTPAPTPTPPPTSTAIPTPTPTAVPTATPTPSVPDPSQVEVTAFLPQGATLGRTAIADLDNDRLEEIVASFTSTGLSTGIGPTQRVGLLVIDWDGEAYAVVWESGPLMGERDGGLEARDINGDEVLEILSTQSMGAAGETLYLFAWDGETYRQLTPQGGAFGGTGSFGAKGVRLEDLDGDSLAEILAGYGPVAIYTDIYRWDGEVYRFVRTVALADPANQPTLETPALPGRIVFSRRGSLWAVGPDGRGLVQLTKGAFDTDPVFSPDGERIAYRSTHALAAEQGPPMPHDIWVISTDGTNPIQLTQTGPGQSVLRGVPSWSPDGTQLAFNEDGRLVVMNADGTGRQVLSERAALTGAPTATMVHWSPTGEQILYAVESGADLPSLALLDVSTGQERALDKELVISYGWMPNGQQVWYTSWADLGLWLVDVASDQRLRLLEDATQVFSLAWSPDGALLAYVMNGGLWMTPSSGEPFQQRVTALADPTGEGPYDLVWSPDGDYLLYAVDYEEGRGLWLVRADGRHQWRLLDGPAEGPAWSTPPYAPTN
ncbi:MAG: TolB family protein, partial [Anaerolineae bacterium]